MATITVKTVDLVSQPSTIEFEFVGDRSMLSSATEYIEVVSPKYMEFIPDNRIMAASAPDRGVFIRYRGMTIQADDVQVNIQRYEVRARKAILKDGKLTQEFDELYFKLKDHTGIGLGKFKALLPSPIMLEGFRPVPLTDEPGRFANIGKEVDRYGLLDINHEKVSPSPTTDNVGRLEFEYASASTSSITAKKAIIFPQKEIQFQRAEVLVAGSRVMRMPLYSLNLMQSQGSNVVTSMVSVNNNQVQVNYPYYLSLKPGQTSLLRFRTGQNYGRGVSGSSGAFLDYELNWNKGDDMDGKFTLSGIGRKDWSIGVQQYARFDDRTTGFGMVEMPSTESIYGSLNLNRTFNGFSMSANTSLSHYLSGIKYSTRDSSIVAEKDPMKVGKTFNLYLGMTAQDSSNSLLGDSQTGVGLRARIQSNAMQIDQKTTMYVGASAAHLSGRNTVGGLTLTSELSLSHRVSSSMTLRGTYNYLRDGYNDKFLGQHRVGLEARYYTDRFQFNILASKGLDINRSSIYADMAFGLTNSWWLTSGYTLDRYLETDFLDYFFGIGYRIQGREVGLIWSRNTNRIGLQLLGAQF